MHGLVLALWVEFVSGSSQSAMHAADSSLQVSVELLAEKAPSPALQEKVVGVKLPVHPSAVPILHALGHGHKMSTDSRASSMVREARKQTIEKPDESLQQSANATHAAESQQLSAESSRSIVRHHLESFKFYPASASRRGIAGEVDVAFGLAMNGRAYQVAILRSSGYEVLDRAALDTVQLAEPFPVNEGKYRFRLRFGRL